MATAAKLGTVPTENGRFDLHHLRKAAHELPPEELPDLIGQLECIKATAWARLMTPAPTPQEHDELLGVAEAASRLGISEDYLYRHSQDYAFSRRQGRKLLFSAQGIDRHIRQQKA